MLNDGPQYDFEAYPPKRNGFVSFWFWLCIVVNAIAALLYLVPIFSGGELMSIYIPMSYSIYAFVASVVVVVGFVMLLKWQKMGFYFIAATSVANVIANFYFDGFGLSTFTPLVSLAILYAILQIKRDGVPCWDNLR